MQGSPTGGRDRTRRPEIVGAAARAAFAASILAALVLAVPLATTSAGRSPASAVPAVALEPWPAPPSADRLDGPTAAQAGAERTTERSATEATAGISSLKGVARSIASTLVRDAAVPETQAVALAASMRRVAGASMRWSADRSTGYGANVLVPARQIDGTLVEPGATFDFWRVVGTPTVARGYRPGGAIVDGRRTSNNVLAGGICIVSTVVFGAALRAGFPISERRPHAFALEGFPLGLDAAVWTSGSERYSLRWRNDSEAPVYVRTLARPGLITVELWTVPTGRAVAISRPTVVGTAKATDRRVLTRTLEPGERVRREPRRDGQNVVVTRVVRDRDGVVLRVDRFVSHYRRVDGVLLVGRPSDPAPLAPEAGSTTVSPPVPDPAPAEAQPAPSPEPIATPEPSPSPALAP